MFFKRKKKEKVVIDSKYQIGELVYFRYNGDLRFGKVSNVYMYNDEICYSVQMGGECPVEINNLPEKSLVKRN